MTSPAQDPRAAQRQRLRRAVLQLIVGVTVLDAVALGTYYLGDIEQAAPRTRMIFTVVWTVATAVTVMVLLRRVRLARLAGRTR